MHETNFIVLHLTRVNFQPCKLTANEISFVFIGMQKTPRIDRQNVQKCIRFDQQDETVTKFD